MVAQMGISGTGGPATFFLVMIAILLAKSVAGTVVVAAHLSITGIGLALVLGDHPVSRAIGIWVGLFAAVTGGFVLGTAYSFAGPTIFPMLCLSYPLTALTMIASILVLGFELPYFLRARSRDMSEKQELLNCFTGSASNAPR